MTAYKQQRRYPLLPDSKTLPLHPELSRPDAPLLSACRPPVMQSLALQAGLEPAACGFGDRCSTTCELLEYKKAALGIEPAVPTHTHRAPHCAQAAI